jgi:transcriptional/translational regulatory protein YebC/TACO1
MTKTTVPIQDEDNLQTFGKFISYLEEDNDVMEVHHNAEISKT